MAFDYSTFATQLGMAAEDKAALDALFGKYPTASEKIDGFVSAEIATRLTPLQADLEKKTKDLDAQFETLASIRGGDSKELDAAYAQVEDAKAKVAVAQERIRRMATEAGLDATAYLKDIDVAAPAKKVEPTVDSPMDAKTILAKSGQAAWNALTSAAELQDVAQEHLGLFGKPLTNSVQLLEKLQERVRRTNNTNLTIRDIWNDEYKVEAKRDEVRQADVDRQKREEYERGKREGADAAALGSQTTQHPAFTVTSPISAVIEKDSKPVTVNGVPEGVMAAMSTYRKIRSEQSRVA